MLASGFVGCGWLLSGWLLLRSFSLGMGRFGWSGGILASIPCQGCNEILASSSSLLLNLPIAAWGFVYFAVLGCLLSVHTALANRTAMLLAALGSGVSLALTAALLVSAPSICALCLLVHVSNLLVFGALNILVRSEPRPAEPRLPLFLRLRVMIGIIAVLLGGAIQATMLKPADDVRKAWEEYRSVRQFKIPIRRDDPALGHPNAPVLLVVFSSFQCPACRSFAGVTHRLTERFPESLRIVFKNYPLGKECNPELVREMEPRACASAFAAEASNRQGEFWRFHDAVFFHSSLMPTEAELNRIAGSFGLDMLRWESDRRSRETEMRVKEDIALARLLGVTGTPAIFLDGRHIPAVSVPILEVLIKREIDQSLSESQISSR